MTERRARIDVAVAMLGARMHYAVPRLLHEAQVLEKFYTDSYAGNKPWLRRRIAALPSWILLAPVKRWLGRVAPELPPEKVVSFELFGLRYALARRRATGTSELRRIFASFARDFNRKVIERLAGSCATEVVWGFNSAALELFKWARERGTRCVLEQTIAPSAVRRELLAREKARWPNWQPGLSVPPSDDQLAEREAAEWELADLIVGGSSFVTDGLEKCGVPVERCRVINYGMDSRRFGVTQGRGDRKTEPRSGEPLRILFAGEVGLRKGAPYLLEALVHLGPNRITARVAGRIALAENKLRPYKEVAQFLGVVPRRRMSDLYEWADVLCLPSVCEGSATVTYEALMSGVPVVTTPNAGSLVRDGQTGRIVPVGDIGALTEALRGYVEDRNLVAHHAAAARDLRQDIGLERYRQDLVDAINSVVDLSRRCGSGHANHATEISSPSARCGGENTVS